MGTKILVVDDDRNICELLKLYLENDGYSVFVANDGQEAVEMFQSKAPELVLLDIMLPKMDGWQVCREIRKTSNTPIIMLTAKGERSSGNSEAEENSKKIVTYDNLEINIVNYELKVKGVPVDTPPKELELIYHFASNPNRVYTRDQLLDEVWGFDYYGDSRTVDVHVKRLREKLEGVSDKWSLKTVWGVGYKFETKE